jgi:predicted transcriptional regulator
VIPVSDVAWTFMSNHGHVLVCLARSPDARLRDVADQVGITERAAQRIVADLVDGGYLLKERQGRRNHYRLVAGQRFRHPLEAGVEIDDFVALVRRPDGA